ncbi:MAG TPA: NUDIX domain-containing protein [Candidatus Limnocylindrales bacterium]|nr:NUDIX domain-containing protein [Candidatus Limnocylindrales bacterium]
MSTSAVDCSAPRSTTRPRADVGVGRSRRSAGVLLYRRSADEGVEVLLAHPGGPIWATRDEGVWTIPKGEIEDGEDPWDVARREFEEETGYPVPDGSPIDLGEITQKGGKVVVAWALEGDLDPASAHSNTFPFQWPPKSGRYITIPEIDRVEWFAPDRGRSKVKDTQIPFIDRLLAVLGVG